MSGLALHAAAVAAAALASANPAHGQTPRSSFFDLPRQRYSESLIAVGVQTGLSVLNVEACRGSAEALRGSFTTTQVLALLLQSAPCRFDFIDPTTVRFRPMSPPPVAHHSPPPAAAPAPVRATSTEASPLEAVIVTAQKRPERLLGAAGAVSVVTASRMQETDTIDVSGVSAGLAAVVLTNLGPGRDKLLLRGVSDGAFTGRTRSTVATYLNDAPITYNAPDPDLVLADVDRVEILRGPQGALYGGGSIGGVYRIVTRAPQTDGYHASVEVRGSSIRGGADGGGLEATANLPLIADRIAVRATAYDIEDGGYLQDDTEKRSNVDRTLRTGGRFAILAKPAPDWSLTLSGALQHLTTADTQYTTLQGPTLRRANLVRESHRNDFGQAGLVIEGPLGAARLHASTSYVRHDYTSDYDASAALAEFGAAPAALGLYDETVRSEILTQDIYLTTPTEAPISYLGGVFASHLAEDTPSFLSARMAGAATPRTLFSEMRRDRIDELALYSEARLRFGRRWTAALGARAFSTKVAIDAQTLTPTQAIVSRTLSKSRDHLGVSPKASLQYEWSSRLSVYALASAGERAGGFNTGGLRATAERGAYAPDRLQNFELGLKSQSIGDRLEVSATMFHDRWRALQTDQYFASGLPYTTNIGDGRLTGLEAAVTWRPVSRLVMEANGLLTTSDIRNVAPPLARTLRGGLPGAPDAALAIFTQYRQPLRDGVDLLLGGRASYVGRSRLTFDVTAADTTSASYVDARLWVQVQTGRYRLALNVSNPADSRANTFAYGNPFSFGRVRQVTPQRPRTLELVASAAF